MHALMDQHNAKPPVSDGKPAFRPAVGRQTGLCPMTENVSNRLMRLPFYNTLDDASRARVIKGVISFQL
jgi:dTDP-4-amino-4,6-dideoxygalactose transaminase